MRKPEFAVIDFAPGQRVSTPNGVGVVVDYDGKYVKVVDEGTHTSSYWAPQRVTVCRSSAKQDMPIITLKNGLRVGNLNSPHPFNFSTGEILPACSPERAERGSLEGRETITVSVVGGVEIENVKMSFALTPSVLAQVEEAQENPDVDIVLVPLPLLLALKEEVGVIGKCRAIRTADRVSKAIYSHKFCW